MNCQIEYVSSDSDVGMPCGKPAVAKCGDCGTAICSDCCTECCGNSFCGQCYDYHVSEFLCEEACTERAPCFWFAQGWLAHRSQAIARQSHP